MSNQVIDEVVMKEDSSRVGRICAEAWTPFGVRLGARAHGQYDRVGIAAHDFAAHHEHDPPLSAVGEVRAQWCWRKPVDVLSQIVGVLVPETAKVSSALIGWIAAP